MRWVIMVMLLTGCAGSETEIDTKARAQFCIMCAEIGVEQEAHYVEEGSEMVRDAESDDESTTKPEKKDE